MKHNFPYRLSKSTHGPISCRLLNHSVVGNQKATAAHLHESGIRLHSLLLDYDGPSLEPQVEEF